MTILRCQPTLREINYGTDQCAYCKMIVADPRYGAEVVTETGKVYTFDALECLIQDPNRDLTMPLVAAVPWDAPRTLAPVSDLIYLISPKLPSPMGANLSSFKSREKANQMQKEHGGDLYNWEELVEHMDNR